MSSIHMCIDTYIHTDIHTYIHMYVCMCIYKKYTWYVYVYTYTHAHSHYNAYMCTRTYTYTRLCMFTLIQTCTRAQHVDTHTHSTHTHTHTEAVWASLWNEPRTRQRDFFQFGGEYLESLQLEELREFFGRLSMYVCVCVYVYVNVWIYASMVVPIRRRASEISWFATTVRILGYVTRLIVSQ